MRGAQAAGVLAAVAAALVPLPAWLVERGFADRVYPRLQAVVTGLSNLVWFALFDVIVLAIGVSLLVAWTRWLRAWRRERSLAPIGRGIMSTAATLAVVYLWFFGVWGLNYDRPPIEARLAVRPREEMAGPSVRALAEHAVSEVNARHARAHAHGFPAPGERPSTLVAALHEVERRLGRPQPTVPARPKHTVFTPFFRWSGTDGMLAPFALETLVNPDLTGPERAFLLAHEWAHLAGFAPEADASFVGVLATLRADEASRYSGWLFLVGETSRLIGPDEREEIFTALGPGPRADLDAIRRRLRSRVEVVLRVSWRAYDTFLKSQGVAEGVESYSRVIELLLTLTGDDTPFPHALFP